MANKSSGEAFSTRRTRPCRISNLVDSGIVGRQAASRYLKALASVGVLEEKTLGREKLFLHPKLLGLLTQDRNDFVAYD